jgi:hypothetical protein
VDYADYVSGRTIAIVGPAQPTHDQSAQIDSHDIVIRLSWVGQSFHPWYGTKCDVSFFNLAASRYWSGSGRADSALATLDWVLTKADYGLTGVTRSRVVSLPEGINANQVPILLHDLSQFRPGPVSVFGADFYWDKQTAYLASYRNVMVEAKPRSKGKTVAEALSGHDWDRQRQVCRDAMGRLDVVGDGRFLQVMALGDDEYRDGMLRAYPGLEC